MFGGEGAEVVRIDEQRATGFYGENREPGRGACFESQWADDWDIKSKVLVGFRNLDGDSLTAAHEGTAFDGFIGSFETFDGEHRAVTDHDGLPDVESTDLLGNA